jgi:hypothetical protein
MGNSCLAATLFFLSFCYIYQNMSLYEFFENTSTQDEYMLYCDRLLNKKKIFLIVVLRSAESARCRCAREHCMKLISEKICSKTHSLRFKPLKKIFLSSAITAGFSFSE